MNSAFDSAAESYDATFTQTKIGRAQRKIVRDYLEILLRDKGEQRILELNSGTGEDAIWFAKKGHSVLATDASEKMLQLIDHKVLKNRLSGKIKTEKLDMARTDEFNLNEKFNMVFSNFAGINCLSFKELLSLSGFIGKLLKPPGRLIMVIMPAFCLWETAYFSLRLNLKEAFRRSSKKQVMAKINGEELLIDYYTPSQINKLFLRDFERRAVKPVGFFIPPSYLEKFLVSKNTTFELLTKLENLIKDWSLLAKFSDHYLVDFQKK
jgi:ubiquinone/menaquinone biosynthesis C-methylase UbiE